MTRIWVTGAAGMLGRRLVDHAAAGHAIVGTTRKQVELSDRAAVDAFAERVRPDVVIHTAYGTRDLERDVVAATESVASACAAHNIDLIHMSTDVVFDGTAGPYAEAAPLNPVHAYGRAKAAAEDLVRSALSDAAIVRTSLICWDEPLDPRSAAVVDALRAGTPPTMFIDEMRNPVRVDDLAASIWALTEMSTGERAGVWHVVGGEAFSRYELALLVARHVGLDASALPRVPSASWGGAEPRPRDCRLLSTRTLPAGEPRSVRTLFAPG